MKDIGLLILRLGAGSLMLCLHGWGKLSTFTDKMDTFPDPLGIGSMATLTLAVFAEFFCSCAVILGLCTRWAAIPLMATMGVAAFIVHASDPWTQKEKALLFFIIFLTLFFLNGGKYSLDQMIKKYL